MGLDEEIRKAIVARLDSIERRVTELEDARRTTIEEEKKRKVVKYGRPDKA